jgi:hypothetical protein
MTIVEPPESPAQAITPGRAAQVPLPRTPADLPGPSVGTTPTADLVQMFGRMAYVWGWPTVTTRRVNMRNRRAVFVLVSERGLLGAVLPIGPVGCTTMVSDDIDPDETFVTSANRS